MSKLRDAELYEPKNVRMRIKMSETQYEALYQFSRRTGIPMWKILRDGATNIIEAAEATLVP